MRIYVKRSSFLIVFITISTFYCCSSDKSIDRNKRALKMMKNEVENSLKLTNRIQIENSTKQLLLRIDSGLAPY
jgi:hypothetical protein